MRSFFVSVFFSFFFFKKLDKVLWNLFSDATCLFHFLFSYFFAEEEEESVLWFYSYVIGV